METKKERPVSGRGPGVESVLETKRSEYFKEEEVLFSLKCFC